MSRGPGQIERAIRGLFDASPDLAFITDELCEHCYPDARPIERKHQVAVLRAAWNVLKDDPDWEAWRIAGMGRGYVFVNCADVESYTLGGIIAGFPFPEAIYRSEKRSRRRPFEWVRAGPGFRCKRPSVELDYIPDRTQLLRRHDLGRSRQNAEDHVADHIAWRDGDAEVRAALQAKWLEYGRRLAARINGSDYPDDDKRYEAADVDGSETLRGLADRLRALTKQNDPDVVRDHLLKIANQLENLA